ncbi:GNAT family N-acetyltransferase [Patulibacter americanus]|uniref:GNAT family N-acetyltransferase n=1 Tax=Patulibacter americanus TaxID=588672 RepID=UPI0003B4CF42|nr:GNAT family N-acetyltransferase [Patulibacter americanus]
MTGATTWKIRDATGDDGDACAAIYAPYVTDTAVTFELEPPTAEEMAARIAKASATHAWLVLVEADGTVAGYAYGGPFAPRAAYRWACETSVYLGETRTGAGRGRALYVALLDRLAARGYRTVLGGMTLPNPASEALHRSLGFEPTGVHRRIGYKHGAWHDVGWTQRDIGPTDDPPAEPR